MFKSACRGCSRAQKRELGSIEARIGETQQKKAHLLGHVKFQCRESRSSVSSIVRCYFSVTV